MQHSRTVAIIFTGGGVVMSRAMNSNIIFEVLGGGSPKWEIYEDKNLLINAGYSDRLTLTQHDSCVFALLRIKNAAEG